MRFNPDLPAVQFDFGGALAVARAMWAFGDQVEAARDERSQLAVGALKEWLGPLGISFSERAEGEESSLGILAERFRDNALEWARAWKEATDLKAMQDWWAEVDQIKNNRGMFQRIGDALPMVGDVVLPPMPEPVPLPVPPTFVGACVA